jgi:hypothetical protein
MGTLTPGAKYVYERNGEVVYAREMGKTERKIIGYSYGTGPLKDSPKEDMFLGMSVSKLGEWVAILQEAESNEVLKEILDRVKVTYYLSKEHGNSKT